MSKLDLEIDGLSIVEIMHRYRNDGSCEDVIRAALVNFATALAIPEFAEWPEGKTNFPKERQVPETAPNSEQSKADGSESP